MILLESKHICKNFGPKPALRDVNVTIECGKIVGLLGPNGSGKTTFLKLINGLLTPSSGELFIGGERPGVITKQHISYSLSAASVSLVSPDWLMMMTRSFFSKIGSR